MGYCKNIVGDSCKKATDQRNRQLRNETKKKKYVKNEQRRYRYERDKTMEEKIEA